MKEKFYVTTPIYYVNAEPHIGHAYTTILADFMSRFYAMLGYDSYFLTGTDEHGDKIDQAATANGTTPQEYADRISGIFRKTWTDLGIGFNDFIRTTEKRHIAVVQQILQKVYDTGDIYFGSYGGFYCVGCERFFTEKEMVDGKCPDHDRKLDFIEEKNYFFKMSKYQDWLIGHIEKNPDFIRPERYRNEVMALLKSEALEDLCISRPKSRLQWGITLPFDENYVTYVWFDALINYISAIGWPDGEKFAAYWPAVQHIIAKDIVKPHGVFWPTMLKAAGIEPYRNLNVHGYWNMQDAKMSKSLGNVVTPKDLADRYGNDQIRYFFLREMSFGNDAKFSEDVIIDRINFDLANDWGNLVNRTVNMLGKFFKRRHAGLRRVGAGGAGRPHRPVQGRVGGLHRALAEVPDQRGPGKALGVHPAPEQVYRHEQALAACEGEQHGPPLLGHEEHTRGDLRHSRAPVPGAARLERRHHSRARCGRQAPRHGEPGRRFTLLDDGRAIGRLGILFPRLEKAAPTADGRPRAAETKKSEKKKGEPAMTEQHEGLVDIADFAKIDIRVAKVLTAARIEGSEKLLELTGRFRPGRADHHRRHREVVRAGDPAREKDTARGEPEARDPVQADVERHAPRGEGARRPTGRSSSRWTTPYRRGPGWASI